MRTRKVTRETHPYPHFFSALLTFGRTSPEIAAALGVAQRSAASYLNGESLPRVEVVKRHAALDEALTLDIAPERAKKSKKLPKTAENMSDHAS